MWLLRNEDKGLVYRIQPGKPNCVSRKEGDLLLVGDQSISRKHAEVLVHNENQRGVIVLKDLGSKYGTFTAIGGEDFIQVSSNEPVTLNDGDMIRFGIQWNVWRVQYFPLVVATSTLNTVEKSDVKQVVMALGGEMANDWQPCCTHLTMNKLTVTVKVVCALASGKPIVVPKYWKALKDALASTESQLPDYKDFVPPLAEALLNPTNVSFTPNPERAKLFSGHTFVAASAKQLDMIKPMITTAGGNAVLFSAQWTVSRLKRDGTVLMQHTSAKSSSQQSQVCNGYLAVARKLKEEGLRCIPEAEIGLSILYCSLAQYCNPKHSSLFSASSSVNTQQITIICPSTQESNNSKDIGDLTEPSCSKKRSLENQSEGTNPRKKANSEDMFSSQGEENRVPNANLPSVSSKCGPKVPIINPSLDMFAPSGQSDHNKNTLKNPTSSAASNVPKVSPKVKNSKVDPSIDMFAQSGQSSDKGDNTQIKPSCQDMFASNQSRQSLRNKRGASSESSSMLNKKQKTDDKANDDFTILRSRSINECSLATTSRSSRQPVMVDDEDDDFSFVATKKNNNKKTEEDDFSFVSAENKHHQKPSDDDDDFAFVSSKSSKKRNRPNNPDRFDSSNGLLSIGKPSCSSKHTYTVTSNKNDEDDEDLFAFTGPASKKRKEINSNCNRDEPDADVQLAIFSKKDSSDPVLQDKSEPVVFEEPPDEKKNIIFSKDNPRIIKKEVDDVEVDELAKELHNTTLIVVKPLLVARPQPVEAPVAQSGKNFKKFRKVTGLNKRVVPLIIGGSDLVPHYASCVNVEDVIPRSPTPPPVDFDEEWAFVKETKKGRKR